MNAAAPTPASLAGRTLEWRVQAPWSRPSWQLVDGESVLVKLGRASWFGMAMVADLGAMAQTDVPVRWRVGPIGWTAMALTPEGAEQPVVIRRGLLLWSPDEDAQRLGLSRWRGDGPLERPDGRRWFWRQHGFIRDRYWEIIDDRDRAIATFRRTGLQFKLQASVTIGDHVESRDDALEAAVFGWYLLLRETAQRTHAH